MTARTSGPSGLFPFPPDMSRRERPRRPWTLVQMERDSSPCHIHTSWGNHTEDCDFKRDKPGSNKLQMKGVYWKLLGLLTTHAPQGQLE